MQTKQMNFISPTGDGFDRTDQADSTQKQAASSSLEPEEIKQKLKANKRKLKKALRQHR